MNFVDLPKYSKVRVERAIKKFNKYYVRIVASIKVKILAGESDFLEEMLQLVSFAHTPYDFYSRGKDGKKHDQLADDFFYAEKPGHVLVSITLALHILGDTENKIPEYIKSFRDAIRKDPKHKLNFLPETTEDLKRRSKDFLLSLPKILAIEDLKQFGDLPIKHDIPNIHYNYSFSAIYELRNKFRK